MGAFAGYTTQEHSLRITPSPFASMLSEPQNGDSLLKQDLSYRHLSTKAFVSGGTEKRLSVFYRAEVFSDHYRLKSDLYSGIAFRPLSMDSLRNNFARNEFGVKGEISFLFDFTRSFKPQLVLPVTCLWVNGNDKIRKSNTDSRHLLFSPLLIIQYSITRRIELFSNISYSNNIGGISEDYWGYLMTSYRNMNRSDGIRSKTGVGSGFVDFSYRNPFTTLFSSFRLSYTNTRSNMLRDIRYNGMLSNVTGIYKPNTAHTFGVSYSLGQSIDAISSEVKINADYNETRSKVLNQGRVSDVCFRSFNLSSSITADIGRFLVAKYDAQYGLGRNAVEKTEMPRAHSFTQSISTSFIPIKKLIFNLSLNHYYNNLIESPARSSWFGNTGVKYKFKNADVMLDWTNIFNTHQFITSSYSDISSYYSVYNLRPMEVLLRVRFKIL